VADTTKLQRWLDLIAYLVGRRQPVSVDEVLEHVPAYASPLETDDVRGLDATRKMFERDKSELRAFGIPIETVSFTIDATEAQEGYRLARRDFYLPYLRLIEGAGPADRPGSSGATGGARSSGSPAPMLGVSRLEIAPEDAQDARDALEIIGRIEGSPFVREVSSALRKLAYDLPPHDTAQMLFAERPEVEALRERLSLLTDALLARKRVRFDYHGIYRGETTQRDVDGYGMLFQRGNWYMIGHDHLRDDLRIFRIERMENVEPNRKKPETPDYEVPEDFALADWRRREAWELGGEDAPVEATVAFRFPRSLWVGRSGLGELVEARPDGSSVRSFRVHQVDPFLRWVLSQDGEARIAGPPELASAYRDMAAEVAALYTREP
jgi:predicted DNA-binding transcriptional regulator YafY